MKWLQRIAQGFSPGKPGPKCGALKGRPNRSIPNYKRHRTRLIPMGRLFGAIYFGDIHPGLKPWAVLASHFMAMPAANG